MRTECIIMLTDIINREMWFRRRRRRRKLNMNTFLSWHYKSAHSSGQTFSHMVMKKKGNTHSGGGLLNKVIDKLPFEIHLPGGYQWCGPGTHVSERLALGQKGINHLDALCKVHDEIYATPGTDRKHADKELEWNAWELVKNSKLPLTERALAWVVVQAMKLKGAVGGGVKVPKRSDSTNRKRRSATVSGKKTKKKIDDIRAKRGQTTKKRGTTRIKKGGILPLLMAALPFLSTIGSLAGGGAAVAKTIFDAQKARAELNEQKRRNQRGEGLFVRPYSSRNQVGEGLFVRPYRRPNGGAGVKIVKRKGKSKN